MVLDSLAGRPVSNVSAGGWLAPLITVAIMTPFFWWTMHFLLAGRVPWHDSTVRQLRVAFVVDPLRYVRVRAGRPAG